MRRRPVVANAAQNSNRHIAMHVLMVTLAIRIVDRVNVILMALKAITVKLKVENVHANRISMVIDVKDVLMVTILYPNV